MHGAAALSHHTQPPIGEDAPVPEPAQGESTPLQHRGKTLVLAACRIVSALTQLSQRVSTFTSVTLKGHRFLEGQQLGDKLNYLAFLNVL